MKAKLRKGFWVGCTLTACLFLTSPALWPDKVASLAIAASDEASIEPVTVPVIDAPRPSHPVARKFRGAQLNRVRALVDVRDGQGTNCMCSGDYKLRFSRWGVPLASFTGHLQETPARLMGSFGILTLEPNKAHQLFFFLHHAS